MKLLLLLLVLSTQLLLDGCALRLARMTDAEKAERLAAERGRLPDLSDPVAKTKSYITISHILLDFAGTAARQNDMPTLEARLGQYLVAVRSARDTMVNSDRNAERQSGGFKDLEIALREQTRLLRDLSDILTFDQRPPVDQALNAATLIREEIFRLLFPQTPLSQTLLESKAEHS